MSIYDKATLVQIPSGYKASGAKLYSVLPANGDGDFTVSADADATRVNSDGLIETTVANQARLSRNFIDGVVQPDPFLLLEPTRTNSTTYSEDFTQTSYWGNVVDVVATTNQTTAPDGSNTGNKIQANSGTNFKILRTGAFTIPSGITMSMFVKRGNHDYILFKAQGDYNFNLSTLTWGGSYSNVGFEEYPDGWIRLYATTSSSVLSYFGIYLTDSSFNQSWTATGNEYVYVWGAQYETGSYPTSYIPTTTSAVTRTIDYASGAGDINTFNDSEGTLFIDAAALGNDGTYRVINISDGTSSNRVLIQLGNNNNQIRADLISGGVTQTSLSTTSYTFTNFNKIAFKYKGNDTALFVNGTQVGTTQIGKTMPTGLDRIDFTNGSLGSVFYFRGKLKQLMYFDTALSNSELIQLTS